MKIMPKLFKQLFCGLAIFIFKRKKAGGEKAIAGETLFYIFQVCLQRLLNITKRGKERKNIYRRKSQSKASEGREKKRRKKKISEEV
jgi:hypothetical protein